MTFKKKNKRERERERERERKDEKCYFSKFFDFFFLSQEI
jgi:hypothetical protein